MPWKETTVISERRRFINAVLESKASFKSICSQYGISTKTGYKWFSRFKQDGYAGIRDHSKRPLTHPARLTEEVVCDLIAFKLSHQGFGPKKVLALYRRANSDSQLPSLSSVNRVLKRAGLVQPRRKKRTHPTGRMVSKIEVNKPNDLWTIDFKGWWLSQDQQRIEPFTVRDAHSRYVLATVHLPDTKTVTVKAIFISLFRKYGMPVAIHSDMGSPFATNSNIMGISQLSAWLISLGILISHSRPGHPQDNGAHERMHRDLKDSVQVRFRLNANQYQAELDQWRDEFNSIRPHEALQMQTPAEVYHKSNRKYQEPSLDYPGEYQIRKVNKNGAIKINGHYFYISTAIKNYFIGLKVIGSCEYAVYFAYVFLGIINLKTLAFVPEKA